MERRYVRQVLNAVGGNKTHAARILGIDRRSLYRRLEEPRHDRRSPSATAAARGVAPARVAPAAADQPPAGAERAQRRGRERQSPGRDRARMSHARMVRA